MRGMGGMGGTGGDWRDSSASIFILRSQWSVNKSKTEPG